MWHINWGCSFVLTNRITNRITNHIPIVRYSGANQITLL